MNNKKINNIAVVWIMMVSTIIINSIFPDALTTDRMNHAITSGMMITAFEMWRD